MTIIRNIIQPIIRPIISRVLFIRDLVDLVEIYTRTLVYLDGVESNTHYRLAKPWTAAGNFEVEFDFATTSVAQEYIAEGSGGGFIRITSGQIVMRPITGAPFLSIEVKVNDGALNTLKLVAGVSGASVYINGVFIKSDLQDWTTFDLSYLGRRAAGSYFKGNISNVKLTDVDTPSNTLKFVLNELTKMYELHANNVFGPELWDYGVISTDADINAYALFAGDYSGNFEADECYVAEVSWTNLTGRIKFNAGDGNFTTDVVSGDTGSATFPLKFLSGGNPRLNVMELSEDHSKADAITMSVRKVSNFITYENIALEERQVYTVADGVLVGPEAWEYSSGWTPLGNGQYQGGAGSMFGNVSVLTDGATYQMQAKYISEDTITGNLKARIDGDIKNLWSPNAGVFGDVYTANVTANLGGSIRFFSDVGTASMIVGDLSVKRIINIAEQYVAPEVVTRTLITLDGAESNSYYKLSAPITFAGDFEIEIDYQLTVLTDSHAFCGGTGNDLFRVDGASNTMLYRIGNSTYTTTGAYTEDSKLNTAKMVRTGGTIKVYRNNVEIGSSSVAVVDWSVFELGKRYIYDFFKGSISNVKLTNITTSNTLEFELNELTKMYELPVNNVFGDEEVGNNTFADTTGWYAPRTSSTISIVSGKLRSTADGTGTFGAAIELTGLIEGEWYLYTGTATSSNPDAIVRLRIGESSNLQIVLLDEVREGSVSVDQPFVATATTMYVGTIVTGHIAGDYVDIDAGISFKSVANFIAYENIAPTPEVREVYTVADGVLVGDDRTIIIAEQAS